MFQTSEGQVCQKWTQIPAEIRPLQLVVLFPGTTVFISGNGKCAKCREPYVGAQQSSVWTDRITLLLLVCEVHTLCGPFITPLPSCYRGKGTERKEKEVEDKSGGIQTREGACGACLPILSDLFFFWETLKLPS